MQKYFRKVYILKHCQSVLGQKNSGQSCKLPCFVICVLAQHIPNCNRQTTDAIGKQNVNLNALWRFTLSLAIAKCNGRKHMCWLRIQCSQLLPWGAFLRTPEHWTWAWRGRCSLP